MRRGAHGHKKTPCRSYSSGGGFSATRRMERGPRGALTSEAAYPLQSSSLQGLLLHE